MVLHHSVTIELFIKRLLCFVFWSEKRSSFLLGQVTTLGFFNDTRFKKQLTFYQIKGQVFPNCKKKLFNQTI
jgi:hypothetical protein